MILKIKRYIKRNGGFIPACKLFIFQLQKNGVHSIIKRLFGKNNELMTDYQYWIDNIEEKYNAELVEQHIENDFNEQPLISILLPVYNVEEKYLTACIDSILAQYYKNWELCIADDKSTAAHVVPMLEAYKQKDDRIKVVYREENGHISEATNSALEIAQGVYIALLDNDDMLKPEALYEFVACINEHPDADMLYSDEDKINEDGTQRIWPAFKPDWSPDAFLCQMYLCHLGMYRTEIARQIGGFRKDFVGSQDYDFALRFTEFTTNIYHIPKILYHWRMIPSSTSMGSQRKNYAFAASYRAKDEMIQRRGYNATIESFEVENSTRIVFKAEATDTVSVIVSAVANTYNEIEKYVHEFKQRTAWNTYEFIIAVNEELKSEIAPIQHVTFYEFDAKTPVQQIIIDLLDKATNTFVFLTDIHVLPNEKKWMQLMIGQAKQSYTGAVGAKVITQDDYIQQAGIIMMHESKKIAYAFHGYHTSFIHQTDRIKYNFNYIAVDSMAMMVEKSKLSSFIKMSQQNLSIAGAYAIDISFALYSQNLFNVYRGDVSFTSQKKLQAKDQIVNQTETIELFEKWPEICSVQDPFFNKNFSEQNGNYMLNLEKNKGV